MATTVQTQTGNKPTASLSNEEILRYSRHLIMPEVGMEGQLKLKQAKVLLIGTGGLGAPLGLYLAAAGVGRLGLVDFDVVDFTNLQRQVTFGSSDVGKPKTEAARARLANLNPDIQIETFETKLPNGPCYRCLYPEPPPPGLVPSCAEGGVLGVLPGIVGSIQAMETIKLILGRGDSLIGRLLLFDALGMKFRELKLRKNPSCPMCGEHRTIDQLIDYYEFCGVRGEEAPGPNMQVPEITPRELKSRLDRGDDLFILDVREPHEFQICNLQGHLIPLGELPRRVHELDSSREIVAHCRSGKRSAEAVDFLRKAGFRKILNLKGGILAWSDEVDPSVPKY